MNEALLGLSIAYVAVAALLAGLLIFSRWPMWVKLGCILLVSSMYFVNYQSLRGLLGWPTEAQLPSRFLLLASSVTEPDKTTGKQGVIHIWATSLDGDYPADEPRAYELPYEQELHGQLEDALKNMRKGVLQLGEATTVDKEGKQIPRDTSRFAQQQQSLLFYDLPDRKLPEK